LPDLSGSWVSSDETASISQTGNKIELLISKGFPIRKVTSNMHNLAGNVESYSARYARYGSSEFIGYSEISSKEGYIYCNKDGTELNLLLLDKYDEGPEFRIFKKQ
jgi:hypothetical protein